MLLLIKISRLVLLVGAYALLAMPLAVIPSVLYPYVYGKALYAEIILAALFPFFIFLLWHDSQSRARLAELWKSPRRRMVFLTFAAFAASALISTIFGVDSWKSFWGTDERGAGVFVLLNAFFFFLLLPVAFHSRKHWEAAIYILFISAAVLSIWGIFENFFSGVRGGTRVTAIFGNPILFAGYLIFPMFWALAYFHARQRLFKIAAGSVIALTVAALMLTQSRGPFLGMSVGFLIAFTAPAFLSPSRVTRRLAAKTALAVIILAVSLVIFRNFFIVQKIPVLSKIASITPFESSANERLMLWQAALKGIKERPFFGWGPENFDYVFDRFYNPYFLRYTVSETWADRAHNLFLDIAVMQGAVGFLIFAALLFAAARVIAGDARAGRLSPLEGGAFLGLLTAYSAHNFFAFDSPATMFLFPFFLAFLVGRPEEAARTFKRQRTNFLFIARASTASAALLSAGLIFWHLRGASASHDMMLATQIPPVRAEEKWYWSNEALKNNTPHILSLRQRFANMVFLESKQYGAWNERFLNRAVEEMEKSAERHPRDFAYTFTLGNLATQAGLQFNPKYYKKAEEFYLRAVKESPARQAAYFQLASVKMLQRDFAAAQEILKPVIDFDARVGEPYWRLGIAYAYGGKKDEAISLWKEAYERDFHSSIIKEIIFAANFAAEARDFTLLEFLYKDAVILEPQKIDHWATLAVAAAENGNIDLARRAVQEAAILDPALKGEAESFLRMLDKWK